MRVLLVKPPTGDIYGRFKNIAPEYAPLGLMYIASVLIEKRHTVKIIDMAIERLDINSFIEEAKDFNPDIVGFTAVTPTVNYAYDMIRILKSKVKCRIVMGGPHVTALPEEAIRMGADAVVRGEAELTIFEALEKNGIFGPSYIEDLDRLPFPARYLLPMEKYSYFFAKKRPLTNIITSRGCPHKCVFCNKQVAGYKYRTRSAKNIVDEMEYLVKDFDIKEVHISDDVFCLDRKRAIDICNEIIKRRLKLSLYPHNGIRVDTVTEALLKVMKEAGFYSIPFGIESGNQQILDKSRKGFSLGQAREAIRLAKKYGFETWGFFIFGLPGDTEKTMLETLDFAKRLNVDIAKFHTFVPFPGSEIYAQLESEDRLISKEWSKYCFYGQSIFRHATCSIKMDKFLAKAYKKYYLRPLFILKTLLNVLKSPRRCCDIIKFCFDLS